MHGALTAIHVAHSTSRASRNMDWERDCTHLRNPIIHVPDHEGVCSHMIISPYYCVYSGTVIMVMATSFGLILLCVFLACGNATKAPLRKEAEARRTPGIASRITFGSPQNVDPKIDCVIKNLAWEYAKKFIPRVRI